MDPLCQVPRQPFPSPVNRTVSSHTSPLPPLNRGVRPYRTLTLLHLTRPVGNWCVRDLPDHSVLWNLPGNSRTRKEAPEGRVPSVAANVTNDYLMKCFPRDYVHEYTSGGTFHPLERSEMHARSTPSLRDSRSGLRRGGPTPPQV